MDRGRSIAAYCRVSTDEQARHSESIADQLEALQDWAKENGYREVIPYLDEGFSARKSYRTRPALRRLLEDIESGKIGLVIFTRLDRWFRNLKDYYSVQEILDKHKCDWKAILEQFNTDTTEGRFFLNLKLSLAEREADVTGDRIKFVFQQKRARGELVSGMLPYGYISKGKKPVKDEAVSKHLEAFFREYLSCGSPRKAMRIVNAQGGELTDGLVNQILRNAYKYVGKIQTAECEPYLTEEELQQLQLLRSRKARGSKRTRIPSMFAGIIYCGECGHRFSGKTIIRELKSTGEKRVMTHYLCSHRQNTGLSGCGNKNSVNELDIESHIMQNLDAAIFHRSLMLEIERQEASASNDADYINRQLVKLEQRKQRGWEAYLDGIVDKEIFEQERRKIDDEMSSLLASKQEVPKIPTVADIRKAIPKNWREMYGDLDHEHKRMFWIQALSRIVIHSDRSITFDLLF